MSGFRHKGNDAFIDFLKGISILSVVFLHNTTVNMSYYGGFCFWMSQAVPIFLLVQVVNTYRKYHETLSLKDYYSQSNVYHLLDRIVKPYLALIVFQFLLSYFVLNENPLSLLKAIIAGGGLGPGSYYPAIYIQFWFLLPIFIILLKKYHKYEEVICIAISIALELLCSFFNLPEYVYRLLCFRYLFLIYLGIQLFQTSFDMNVKRWLLSVVSVIFLILDIYFHINMSPFFFNTAWVGVHWIAYYYTAYLLLNILNKLYKRIQGNRIALWILKLGKKSYSIFLAQMFFFWAYYSFNVKFSENHYINYIIFFALTTILSLGYPFYKECILSLMQTKAKNSHSK